jgi:hypothetical protein
LSELLFRYFGIVLFALLKYNSFVDRVGCERDIQMEWITVKEAGVLWGISARRVAIFCAEGRITNAQKLGSFWVVPKGTSKPIDERTKAAKQAKKDSDGGNG